MTVLPLVIAPDPLLKQKSATVEQVDEEVRTLLDDMADTMYDSRGIGLAAVQVGVLRRVVVIDIGWREEDDATRAPLKLVNPEIVTSSEERSLYNEGCLSFPEHYSEVERPAIVKVRYQDEQGKSQEMEATGLLATCVQHEIDHTNGITFVDHISRLKRDVILKKLSKAKKQGMFDPHECGAHCGHDHDHDHLL